MSLSSEKVELKETIYRLLDNMLAMISSQTGREGVELRSSIGDVRSNYYSMIYDGTFPAKLLECFTSAKKANVKLASLVNVHQKLFEESPVGDFSTAVVQMAIVFCLSTESRIISELGFKSREDIELLIDKMKIAFDTARLLTADAPDTSAYQQLTNLAGALMAHLADVARPLPRMVTFELKAAMPALALSQYVYYEAGRWEEIVDENKVVHPLFCPRTIRGLSA